MKYRWMPFGKVSFVMALWPLSADTGQTSLYEMRGAAPIMVTDPLNEEDLYEVDCQYVGPDHSIIESE